jgi:hypothetical protein
MSDPSTSANGLTLDIANDDPGIAYSREAYAELCRLRAENDINRAHAVEHYEWLVKEREQTARLRAEIEALREALKPFADMCDEIESCAAEYPADHPASDPEEWFTGCVEWPAWRRAKALYEGEK